MMIRVPLFLVTTILLTLLLPPVAPLSNSNTTTTTINTVTTVIPRHLNTNSSSLKCIDLVDFFYEIVLALSSYPPSSCSKMEERQISTFLQNRLNDILKKTRGTINTQNKLCDHAINSRRLLLSTTTQPSQWLMEPFHSWLFPSFGMDHHRDHRMLLRAFVYVGGGRCRFCFYDNYDKRRQLLSDGLDDPSRSERDLLEFMFYEIDDDDEPVTKVADPILCPSVYGEDLFNSDMPRFKRYKGWTNKRLGTIKGAPRYFKLDPYLGPYVAGESFGSVFTVAQKTNDINKKPKRTRQVRSVVLKFRLWAFDVPNQYTHELLGDEPFYLFINGIKLDFNVLLKAPGVITEILDGQREVEAKTFAGIEWFLDEKAQIKNLVLGSRKDREYNFQVKIPSILFENVAENKIKVDFFIKPQAKAKSYGVTEIVLSVDVADCEILGLEKSPFDEFKYIMEHRLESQLGLDLAHQFQNKAGHCLKDKVPMVGVHLVQKDKWSEANPRC